MLTTLKLARPSAALILKNVRRKIILINALSFKHSPSAKTQRSLKENVHLEDFVKKERSVLIQTSLTVDTNVVQGISATILTSRMILVQIYHNQRLLLQHGSIKNWYNQQGVKMLNKQLSKY